MLKQVWHKPGDPKPNRRCMCLVVHRNKRSAISSLGHATFAYRDGYGYALCLFLDGSNVFVVRKYDSFDLIDPNDIVAWCAFPYVDEMEAGITGKNEAEPGQMYWYTPDECLPDAEDCMTLTTAWFDDIDLPSYIPSMGYLPRHADDLPYGFSYFIGATAGLIPPEHIIAWMRIPSVSDILRTVDH